MKRQARRYGALFMALFLFVQGGISALASGDPLLNEPILMETAVTHTTETPKEETPKEEAPKGIELPLAAEGESPAEIGVGAPPTASPAPSAPPAVEPAAPTPVVSEAPNEEPEESQPPENTTPTTDQPAEPSEAPVSSQGPAASEEPTTDLPPEPTQALPTEEAPSPTPWEEDAEETGLPAEPTVAPIMSMGQETVLLAPKAPALTLSADNTSVVFLYDESATSTINLSYTAGAQLTVAMTQDGIVACVPDFQSDHGTLRLQPCPDMVGAVILTVTASLNGETQSVSIRAIVKFGPNDAPVVIAAPALTVLEDSDGSAAANQLNLNGVFADPDGDPLRYWITTQPQHGSVRIARQGSDEVVIYTPNPLFFGTDSFMVTTTDDVGGITDYTAPVTVTHVNHPPQPAGSGALNLTTEEDIPLTYALGGLATDVDGDTLSYSVKPGSGPMAGSTATVSGNTLRYVPKRNYNQSDDFVILASDGNGATAEIDVHVVIAPVNDAASLKDDHAITNKDVAVDIDVLANDTCADISDPAPYTYTLKVTGVDAASAHGGTIVLLGDGLKVRYTPAENFRGTDTFRYSIARGGETKSATVTVSVTQVNYPPVFTGISDTPYTIPEDTAAGLSVNFSIVDDDTPAEAMAVQYSVINDGTSDASIVGTVALTLVNAQTGAYRLTFHSAKDKHGTVKIKLLASDNLLTADAMVTIDVTPVNDAPVAHHFEETVDEDTEIVFEMKTTAHASDVDNAFSELLWSVTAPGGGHSFAYDDATGKITFQAKQDFAGDVVITFVVTDPGGQSGTGTVTLHVLPVNDPPLIAIAPADRQIAFDEDGAYGPIDLGCQDPDGDALTMTAGSSKPSVINAAGLVISDGKLTITSLPDANWKNDGVNQPIDVTVTVSDGNETAQVVIQVFVNPVEDRPQAKPDEYTTEDGVKLTLRPLDNDFDPDGDSLVARYDGDPAPNVGYLNRSQSIYEIPVGFQGDIVIQYFAEDAKDHTGDPTPESVSRSTITIHVVPRGVPPIITQVDTLVAPMGAEHTVIPSPVRLEVWNLPYGQTYEITAQVTDTSVPGLITGLSLSGGQSGLGDGLVRRPDLTVSVGDQKQGEAIITVRAETQKGVTAEMRFKVKITGVNTPPVPADYTGAAATVNLGETIVFPVRTDATDDFTANADLLLQGVDLAGFPEALGEVTFDAQAGTVTFRSNGGHGGHGPWTGSFAYTLVDEGRLSGEGAVSLTIPQVDRAPLARNDHYLDLDGYIFAQSNLDDHVLSPSPLWNDEDPDGDPLTLLSVTPLGDGASVPRLAVSPDGSQMLLTMADTVPPGSYPYTYTLQSSYNAANQTDTAQITVLVEEPAQGGSVPRITAHTFEIREDCGEKTFDLSPYLHIASTVTALQVSVTGGGALLTAAPTTTGRTITLTPAADMNGTVELDVVAQNSKGDSLPQRITVRILPENDGPQIVNKAEMANVTVANNTGLRLSVQLQDVDNEKPAALAKDKDLTLTVTSTNAKVVDPARIRVEHTAGSDVWSLLLPVDQQDVDTQTTIQLVASDGYLVDNHSFLLTVNPLLPPTLLTIPKVYVDEDSQILIPVVTEENNPSLEHINVSIFSPPGESPAGMVKAEGNNIVFLPAKDFFHKPAYGPFPEENLTIQYQLRSASGVTSPLGQITVHVWPMNDAPVIRKLQDVNDPYGMQEDTARTIVFEVVDVDLGFVGNRGGAQDQGEGSIGVNVQPADGETYVQSVSQSHSQNGGARTVTLTVTPKEDQFHPTGVNSALTVTANHDDVANPPVKTVQSCAVHITPVNDSPAFTGVDPASDGTPMADTTPSGDLVVYRVTPEDTALTIDLTSLFADVDDTTLTLSSVGSASHGTVVSVGGGKAKFTPAKDYFTELSGPVDVDYGWFSFTVSDPHGGKYTGKVRIRITPVNDPPLGVNLSETVAEDQPLTFNLPAVAQAHHAQDVDDAFDDLVFTPNLTAATAAGHTVTYDPDTGAFAFQGKRYFSGAVEIPYTLSDPQGAKDETKKIVIRVTPVNNAPYLAFSRSGDAGWRTDEPSWDTDVEWHMPEYADGSETTAAGAPFLFRAWDVESSNPILLATLGAVVPTVPAQIFPDTIHYPITGSAAGDRTITLKPLKNKNGTVQFTFTVKDPQGLQTTATATLVVDPFNSAPVVKNQTLTLAEDAAPLNGSITATDIETAEPDLTYSLVNSANGLVDTLVGLHGTLTLGHNTGTKQTYTYTPMADHFGTDTFPLRVTDDGDGAAAAKYADATLTFNVTPVNDAPSAPSNVQFLAPRQYKQGDTVKLAWTAGDDLCWAQETKRDDLTYRVEYSLDGNRWTVLQTAFQPSLKPSATGGVISCNFTAPAGNSDHFQVRVRTIDNGALGNTPVTYASPLTSAYAVSTDAKLDNTPPTAAHTGNPTVWTNTSVAITLTTGDGVGAVAGATGVRSVTSANGLTVTPVGNDFRTVVSKNGLYRFTVKDQVGNETTHSVAIANIDKLAPNISCQPVNNTAVNAVTGNLAVALSFADKPAVPGYGRSGLATQWFILNGSPLTPDVGDGAWTPYTEAQALTLRGAYYMHAKAIDKAGNVAIKTFGPFLVQDNAPRIAASPNPAFVLQNGYRSDIVLTTADVDDDASLLSVALTGTTHPSVVSLADVRLARDGANPARWHVTVTPDHDAYDSKGDLYLTFTVTDPYGKTGACKLLVYVEHVNHAPVTKDITATIYHDQTYSAKVSADDSQDHPFESPGFVFSCPSKDGVKNGSLRLKSETGEFTYTPKAGFVGTEVCYITVKESRAVAQNENPDPTPEGVTGYADGTLSVKAKVTIRVLERKKSSPQQRTGTTGLTVPIGGPLDGHMPGEGVPISGLYPFSFLKGVEIPDGAAAYACTPGLLISELGDILGSPLYNDEQLQRIYNMTDQMALPLDFAGVDWQAMPEEGLAIPLLVEQRYIVGALFIRRAPKEAQGKQTQETQWGFAFELELAQGVLASQDFCAVNLIPLPEQIQMIETQTMRDFDELNILHTVEWIPEERLQGKVMLFVALPCVYTAQTLATFTRTGAAVLRDSLLVSRLEEGKLAEEIAAQ